MRLPTAGIWIYTEVAMHCGAYTARVCGQIAVVWWDRIRENYIFRLLIHSLGSVAAMLYFHYISVKLFCAWRGARAPAPSKSKTSGAATNTSSAVLARVFASTKRKSVDCQSTFTSMWWGSRMCRGRPRYVQWYNAMFGVLFICVGADRVSSHFNLIHVLCSSLETTTNVRYMTRTHTNVAKGREQRAQGTGRWQTTMWPLMPAREKSENWKNCLTCTPASDPCGVPY